MKTFKKQILLVAILFSVVIFAQKEEIKAAGKALAKNNFTEALASLNKVESMLGNLDNKTKAKFYFLKSKALNGSGKVTEAANIINELMAFEKKIGKEKYTKEAEPMLQELIQKLRSEGIKEYDEKKWSLAKNTLAQVFELNALDTSFLNYAAMAAYQDKDLDLALVHYQKLNKVGYTGITTNYSAINVETKKRDNFSSKNEMDLMIKSKTYIDPKTEVLETKKGDIIKNIANIYLEKGDNEKALEAIYNARKESPKDVNIILTAADIAYKMGKNEEFITLMNEAIKHKPNDPVIYNNIGIVSRVEGKNEEAKKAFKKAIELKPDYKEAIINLADTELRREDVIVKEMEKNMKNFDKFDALKAKQLELFREILPLYEKAYKIKDANYSKNNEKNFLKTMMAIYENLEMYDKMNEVKAFSDSL
ncbi:MAG: tetratricopeptide repeat protein [Flavobacteriaceae bacterium]|nr:tetratricopeptide repeat protein [Flavobacteriaceae bacterium]